MTQPDPDENVICVYYTPADEMWRARLKGSPPSAFEGQSRDPVQAIGRLECVLKQAGHVFNVEWQPPGDFLR